MAVHKYTDGLSADLKVELVRIAKEIGGGNDRGVLAMDEDNEGFGKLLSAQGLENNSENRRAYRKSIFETEGIEKYVSAVILFDETVYQNMDDGTPIPQFLASKGILPGIKVDLGTVILQGTTETVAQGLDNLVARAKKYRADGCRFAKFRAPIEIGDNKPSALAVQANAEALARYATACQQAGIVPIVEPDIVRNGSHDIDVCQRATEAVLSKVVRTLSEHHVYLEGIVLKPNLVTAGESASRATPKAVAEETLRTFRRVVPAAVPTIAFLSGGLSEDDATAYLNAVNQKKGDATWRLTFSYGRALQVSAWKAFGKNKDGKAAQAAFLKRVIANSNASRGQA